MNKVDIVPPSTIPRGNRILGLDGLRAISILLVFVGHYANELPGLEFLTRFIPPMFGVSVFFVVSGYLITDLLIREFSNTGDIDVRKFYIRRFLRLSPSLYFYLITFSVIFFLADGHLRVIEILSSFAYLSNYYYVAAGESDYFIPTWSLAVEEHYYLLFPTIFCLLVKRSDGWAVNAIISAIVAVAAWRMVCFFYLNVDWHDIYQRTDTRIDTILFGSLAACFLNMPKFQRAFAVMMRTEAFVSALLVIGMSIVYRDEAFRSTWRYVLQAGALAVIVAYLTMSRATLAEILRGVLETAPFVYLGRISYPLYLWHLTVLMFLARALDLDPYLTALLATVLSLILAAGSYHGIESAFLKLRRRFGSHV